MKTKHLLFILLVVAFTTTNAQTVYHYKCTAKVDPATGVKTAYSGRNRHIVFNYNKSILWVTDEYGKKSKVFTNLEPTSQSKVYSSGYGLTTMYTTFFYGDNDGSYSYVKTENNMLIYCQKYQACKNQYTSGFSREYWIYISKDLTRINEPDTEAYANMFSMSIDSRNIIWVYELYDQDQVSERPKPDKPGSPSVLY